MDIGKNIKTIREAKRMKQIEVAELLGVDNSYYARQEKRGNKLTVEQVENIATALGVTSIEILTGETQTVQNKERIKELEKEILKLENENKRLNGVLDITHSIIEIYRLEVNKGIEAYNKEAEREVKTVEEKEPKKVRLE